MCVFSTFSHRFSIGGIVQPVQGVQHVALLSRSGKCQAIQRGWLKCRLLRPSSNACTFVIETYVGHFVGLSVCVLTCMVKP